MKKEEFFNYKVYDYGEEIQVRVYEKPIKKGGRKKDSPKNSVKKNDLSFADLETGFENGDYNLNDIKNILDGQNRDVNRSAISSANRAKNKVYEYARSNKWEWFITLTFNPKKIDSTDYSLLSKKVSQWLKDMRKKYAPDLKYIMVPELHSDGKKFHFHALMSDIGTMKMVDSGLTTPSGNIYNLGNYKLGFTTATKISDTYKASNYISKYITKTLCQATPNKKKYWNSYNLKKPVITEFLMSDDDIKKQLESMKNQVACEPTIVSVDLPEYRNKISYYEISLT